ncbi:MAG TPA: thioredoxin domain-containing protein [Nitrospirota bacterium]|nr:thioredoxin domain-containing protein [Nitrospirota bacterium]
MADSIVKGIFVNRLANEKSAYLHHAAYQKVDWYPWSEEAFDRARREDKPLFLSTGAVWCHWCHVMAKQCFENDDIVNLMNELFINIKLDRDERPDIDRRYQQAVAAMGAGSGWPLSVFLTPEKKPFFGGTYFPPEDMQGRPGFKNVLSAVSNFYKTKRGDVTVYSSQVMDTLQPEVLLPDDLNKSFLDEAVKDILSHIDSQHGGFGTSPKFPMPGALEFLLRRFSVIRDTATGDAVRRTLDAMARGGFHDQIGGGFHRYSVDEAWIVPHFEKMADDNAWLLRNYIDAYAVFSDERFKDVARGIIAFTRDVLSDAGGGFHASQDADVTPDDEGGYFTWTDDDFKKVLTDEEYAVLTRHLFHERGYMHHDPSKKVLAVAQAPEEIAAKLGRPFVDVSETIRSGKNKLLRERSARKAPFVDQTLYTSLNGMLITSYLQAYRVLGDPSLKDFALLSLDRILRDRLMGNTVYHSEGVPAVLDDIIYLIEALIAAYEGTGMRIHLDRADALMTECMERFGDEGGGFFDTEGEVLGTRLRRIEDIPHPSANAIAVMLLLKLFRLTGKDSYRIASEKALKIFSRAAREMGIHAGTYFCALDAYFSMLILTVEADPGSDLSRAALALSGPYSTIRYGADNGRVIPCINETCFEPIYDTVRLKDFFLRLPPQ